MPPRQRVGKGRHLAVHACAEGAIRDRQERDQGDRPLGVRRIEELIDPEGEVVPVPHTMPLTISALSIECIGDVGIVWLWRSTRT